jgi:hypothetical protein
VHPLDRIKKKNSKRSTTLEVKTFSFYWTQQSRDVSPTPSTCQAEGIFGLGWPDWACYFFLGGALLTTGWWDPAICQEPSVKMSTIWDMIPYQHLSRDFWPSGFLTPHSVPINIYLNSLVIFVRVLTTEVIES